ncbi:MAG: hypothetical protein WCC66_03015 [Rhizobiaceae bacterium]
MKRLFVAAMLATAAAPAFAETPTEAVSFFYKDPGSELSPENRDRFIGKAKEMLDLSSMDEESESGPCVNFMLSLGAQDFDEVELEKSLVFAEAIAGDQATVKATFEFFDEPGEIIWSLERAGETWKISDIASTKDDWKLSTLDCTAQAGQ